MRNFWIGVLTGVAGALLVCGVLGFVATARARADVKSGTLTAPPFFNWSLLERRGFLDHHGEFGTIDELGAQSLTLIARGGEKKTLSIGDDTEIYSGKTKIALSDLGKGQRVIVIAVEQADGTLKAKLIRVMSASMLLHLKSTES